MEMLKEYLIKLHENGNSHVNMELWNVMEIMYNCVDRIYWHLNTQLIMKSYKSNGLSVLTEEYSNLIQILVLMKLQVCVQLILAFQELLSKNVLMYYLLKNLRVIKVTNYI